MMLFECWCQKHEDASTAKVLDTLTKTVRKKGGPLDVAEAASTADSVQPGATGPVLVILETFSFSSERLLQFSKQVWRLTDTESPGGVGGASG